MSIPVDIRQFFIFVLHEYPFNGVQLSYKEITKETTIFRPPLMIHGLKYRHLYIPALLWLYNPDTAESIDVTITDKDIDTGNILKQLKVKIGPGESLGVSIPHWFMGDLVITPPSGKTVVLESGWIILS